MAQRLKCLSPMWETWVQSLGREDPLEEEMATRSSILAGESHGWRSLVGYSPQGCKESDTTERLHFHFRMMEELSHWSHPMARFPSLSQLMVSGLVFLAARFVLWADK